jgi:hypothetical protein
MKKTYRISVYNKTMERRELLWTVYTSKKAAQLMIDAINALPNSNTVDAKLVVKD